VTPEGTYLVWLDCRDLEMDSGSIERLFQEAGVGMMPGRGLRAWRRGLHADQRRLPEEPLGGGAPQDRPCRGIPQVMDLRQAQGTGLLPVDLPEGRPCEPALLLTKSRLPLLLWFR
jgi:hypothetical protein